MGFTAHPVGIRLGIHRKWKSNWFFESKNYANFIHLNLNIEKFFKGFLYFYGVKTLLLNCQLIKLASNQVFIFIFFYRLRKKYRRKRFNWRFKKWRLHLESYFRRTNSQFRNRSIKYFKHVLKYFFKRIRKFFFFKNLYTIMSVNNFKKVLHFVQKQLLITQYDLKIQMKNFKYFSSKLSLEVCDKLYQNFNLKIRYCSVLGQFLKKFNQKKCILKNLDLHILWKCLTAIRYRMNLNLTSLSLNTELWSIGWADISIWSWEDSLAIDAAQWRRMDENNDNKHIPITELKGHIYKYMLLNKMYKQKVNKYSSFYKQLYYKHIRCLRKFKKSRFYKQTFALKKRKNKFFNKKSNVCSIKDVKRFLSKLTNLKINIIFINTLSFAKFYYLVRVKYFDMRRGPQLNVLKTFRRLNNKFKFHAIFIKDFVYLSFLGALFKNTHCLVKFMAEQFKRLPRNRKQLKLLQFLNQTLKIFFMQRPEFRGFRLQVKGRLNRRTRTKTWKFQRGILSLQTADSRVEYSYSEGFTRSGLIGIKLWFFYKKFFKKAFQKKMLQYLYYSRFKKVLCKNFYEKEQPFKFKFFKRKKKYWR